MQMKLPPAIANRLLIGRLTGRPPAFVWILAVALALPAVVALKAAVVYLFARPENAPWGDLGRVLLAVFSMGLLCGLTLWLGRSLHQRWRMAGDALLGVAVMEIFFTLCMVLFEPALLTRGFQQGGLPMYCLGAVVGLIGGIWIGRDLRKERAAAGDAQAVILAFSYGLPDLEPLRDLEALLEAALAGSGLGEVDGDVIAQDLSDGELYLYGPDAKKLFAAIRPTLEATPFLLGARVTLSSGSPEDRHSEEQVILGEDG